MNARSAIRVFLASTAVALLTSTAPAAPQAITVEFYGAINRGQYLRVERIADKQFVVFSNFAQVEETRLVVKSSKTLRSMPPVRQLFCELDGKKVTVHLTGPSNQPPTKASVDRGDGTVRAVSPLPAPAIRILRNGYYNRSSYVRLEETTSSGNTKQFIVLSGFGRSEEVRLPVVRVLFLESFPGQTEYISEGGGRKVHLYFTDGNDQTARISIDGGDAIGVALLGN